MTTTDNTTVNGAVNAPSTSIPFKVEQDYERLEISVGFSQKGWYSLFVFDSKSELRAQALFIQEPKTIVISTCINHASFSSTPGIIPQGDWKIEIESPAYSENHTYTIQIMGENNLDNIAEEVSVNGWSRSGSGDILELSLFSNDKIYNSESRWYKGDFHTHTTESDGKMTPAAGMSQAKTMELDFFVATDHNIIPTKWISEQVMVIPGIEITSSKGHFNALGLTKWVNWRPTTRDGGMETEVGMNRVIREVKEVGAVVSINHPMLKPWEWQFHETKLAEIDVIEIWNDPTYKDNPIATEQALHLWNVLWNDGHRIFGIGGSDSHLLPTESYQEGGAPSVIGDPATYIYCEGLSANSLLKGVLKGHAYVSRGPEYAIKITANGKSYLPGDDLSQCFASEDEVVIHYQINPAKLEKDAQLYWISEGQIISKEILINGQEYKKQFNWNKKENAWLRFEVRSEDGTLLSFANPIYSGTKQTTLHNWKDLLRAAKYL
ncbi:MAG: CehA/McbA family metallohydrolase [Neobacillus sp.]